MIQYRNHVSTDNIWRWLEKNAYADLIPIFKELCSHLQTKQQSDIDKIKSILISELNAIQHTAETEDNISSVSIGNFVSSYAMYVKKRKTHGTNYYRK